jgi:hypothetical protein
MKSTTGIIMQRTLLSSLLAAGLVLASACDPTDSKLPDDTGMPAVDADGDGFDSDEDCNDNDPDIYPGAEEVCDEADNDCDGETDEQGGTEWYPDADGDGYAGEDDAVVACQAPNGYHATADDCDDSDDQIHPGAGERCNGIDDDCDGEIDEDPPDVWYADADDDGYGNVEYSTTSCDPGSGWVADDSDCDDTNAAINPGADEACNGIDDDCDEEVDEGLDVTWYGDGDGDGYGDASVSTEACDPGSGWVDNADDCDDTNASTHPAASEYCDGIDNDCDTLIDDADVGVVDPTTWYYDGDSDGYGLDHKTSTLCDQPSGYALYGGDCDDTDTAYNPGASETDCTDPADYNCDGSTGYADDDADGFAACEECDDSDALIFPGADEVCDGADNDCDGTVDEDDAIDAGSWCTDGDGDGYGDTDDCTVTCNQPAGSVAYAADHDCDDAMATVNPGASEICNGIDDDCDALVDDDDDSITGQATWYADSDADGYGDAATTTIACVEPSGFVADDTDCDDSEAAVNPAATEVCNGIDDDCDALVDDDDSFVDGTTTWYLDYDADGYGGSTVTVDSCLAPSGYVGDSSDCDDLEATTNPGADERCDSVDNDCDGTVDEDDAIDALTWYADTDADGYGDPVSTDVACDQPSGYVADDTDCDDGDADVSPGADETCNGIDDDCDGATDEDESLDVATWYADVDADGYGDPGSTDIDCDQPTDYVADSSDCDDTDPAVNPAATETCNGIDDDCDGATDEDDASDALTWYADTDADGYGDADSTTLACNEPSGFVTDDTDCDDSDGDVFPGATELCNGIDDDCDGATDEDDASDALTWYADSDADGYGDAASTTLACSEPSGFVAVTGTDDTDCDDSDAAVNPAATELCNGIDDDCDGTTDEDDAADALTWYADDDSDGYGDPGDTALACSQPSGHVADSTDCDDHDDDINPGATELCNGIDDDCDGTTDEDDASDAPTWYADDDGDSYGDPGDSTQACSRPSGHVADSTDCDDSAAAVNPAATELCNGIDDDCDGTTDEDDASDALTWYADDDGDSYGDPGDTTLACSQPSGHVADSTDCDDGAAAVNPAATELCDGIDNDCDGTTDEDDAADAATWYADDDGDSYGDPGSTDLACTQPSGYVADSTDCDDGAAAVNPAATELCNGVDDDCDGTTDEDDAADAATWYADDDGDSYGDPGSTDRACSQPSGYVADATDCDDSAAAVNPAATELCDSIDNDCDGTVDEDDAADASTWYADADVDGYGDAGNTTRACSQPAGYLSDATDCDDHDDDINPGATELCNGVDDDCDGTTDEDDASGAPTWYADADGDSYGNPGSSDVACAQPTGYVADNTDCDDGNASTYPGATDAWYDGVDSDCAGDDDYDQDVDGHRHASYGGSDCDDTNASIYPGAADTWYDGVDSDCAGNSDYDRDGDGYDSDGFGGSDCDDLTASTHPGAADAWYDGVDSDCAGDSDYDADLDGHDHDAYGGDDCDDSDAYVSPSEDEICDGIDNDCDGSVDEDDGAGGSCSTVLEDFEGGVWPATGWTAYSSGGSISTSATYEGSYAGYDIPWHYNTTETVAVGQSVSMWIRMSGGRAYLGFDSDSGGTRSFVACPNTGDIRFQDNPSYGYTELSTTSYSVPTGQWLEMVVTLDSAYTATGELYNSSGTLLATVSETYSSAHGGGYVAIRTFGGNYLDYISIY